MGGSSRDGPVVNESLLSSFLYMRMVTPVCQCFDAHLESQAAWHTRVKQLLCSRLWAFHDRFHHKPQLPQLLILRQIERLQSQWRCFPPLNAPPVCSMVWKWFGAKHLWNTLCICQGCPLLGHKCVEFSCFSAISQYLDDVKLETTMFR